MDGDSRDTSGLEDVKNKKIMGLRMNFFLKGKEEKSESNDNPVELPPTKHVPPLYIEDSLVPITNQWRYPEMQDFYERVFHKPFHWKTKERVLPRV